MTAYVLKRKRPPVLQYTGDYTKTGSFGQIDKGVVSSYNVNDYLRLPKIFDSSSSNWEIVLRCDVKLSASSTQKIIFGGDTSKPYNTGFDLGIKTDNYLYLWLTSNGSSWNIANGDTNSAYKVKLTEEGEYIFKLSFTGSSYILAMSINGGELKDYMTVNNSTKLYQATAPNGFGGNCTAFYPSESYININGERWWSGDSYTKVGGWIDDNVVSGFSASNYLITKSVFNPLEADFEFVFKIKLDSHTVNVILAENRTGQFSKVYLCIDKTQKIFFGIGTGSAWRIRVYSNVLLELNTDYWIKVVKSNGTFYIYYSLDGKDYILDNSVADASVFPSITVEGRIGCWKDSSTGTSYFHGSIDLTESYIKLNGEYWWRGAKYVNADKCYVLKRKRPTEYRKTVIDTATAGTYTFDVAKDNTTARIKLVGGGGGAGQVVSGVAEGSGGGSGAFIFCRIKLSAGTYTITNGAGGGLRTTGGVSKLSIGDITLLTANGGTGGANAGGAVGIGGTYEISEEANIEELYYASNGNSGTRGGNMVTGYGGASLYNGYGRGGNTRSGGVAGYNWVELVTDETNYDTKFNRDVCYVLRRK